MAESVWDPLSQGLRDSRPYRALRQQLGRVAGLPLPAAAWVIQLLAEDLGRPFLVLVPREIHALTWTEAAQLVGGGERTVYFPAPALTPYQETEVSLHVRAQESVALQQILSLRHPVVVCTPRALFRRLPEEEAFRQGVVAIRRGQEQPIDGLTAHLLDYGYRRSDLVVGVGEFAVRGGVFDLYPPNQGTPIRLDLFGDTVDSIRRFDPTTQRSHGRLEELEVLPLSLYRAGAAEARGLAAALASHLDREGSMEIAQRVDALAEGETFPGWENYLPLLGQTSLLPTALGRPLVVAVEPRALETEAAHYLELLWAEFETRQEQLRLAVRPELLAASEGEATGVLRHAEIVLDDGFEASGDAIDFQGSATDLFHNQLPRFPREVETARARGERLLLVGAREHLPRIQEVLEGRQLTVGPGAVELVEGELERGFRLPPVAAVVFSEHQLFLRRGPGVAAPKARHRPFISDLRDLKVGDFVVHEDHGIGQFIGMRAIGERVEGAEALPPAVRGIVAGASSSKVEVMEIAYAGEKILLFPLNRLDQIQKYSGIEGVAPRLDELGGSSWNRTKRRIKKSLRNLASELLKLYAERELAEAPVLERDSDLQSQFEAAFDYEETADQLEATAAIKRGLESQRPMDLLLCGDVGFGKTEVAMRAAFKAVDSGFQVAVLAPTTILADQHVETFRRRFAGFPVEVEMISRFRSPSEVREIRQRVAEGKVDILIGTHRLLSRDVEIPKLGLLIIDEEQRFGVSQKERLKKLRKDVHVLAMSATPVPRTLQLSLAGIRDLAIIESPPKDRMAVETRILPFASDLIREAIEFEVQRGGQVYYVYNRVETIERVVGQLREIVPHLRLTVGHGQLEESELARRMHAFTRGEYDVLVATTIIENGIDIPNVNTMIVHRADRFGLAQLYQLRGRVGRSNQLAYCYLLTDQDRILAEDTRKRLVAIREFSDLGAGFRIAARDLEIRGAGNLLGAEQSGHIAEVGIETYLKMLEETVRELKGEAIPEAPSASIDLPVAMAIPPDYIGDTNLRMDIYRRLASVEEETEAILAELRDRFGPPPESVQTLVKLAELKRLADSLRVQAISAQGGKLVIRLRRDARINVELLIRLVSESPGATFSPSGVLTLAGVGGAEGLAVARETLQGLAQGELEERVS